MKKYLPQIDVLTLAASALGIILHFWLLSIGTDDRGLYPKDHISFTLLLVLSIGVAVMLFLLAGAAGKSRTYHANFHASLPGAAGFAAAGCGMALSAVQYLLTGSILLYKVAGAVGILAAGALFLGGFCRWKGKKPHFLVFALPCAYFGLRLFCMGHTWGDEPEMQRFLISFFATAACVLACYQLWAFTVDLGNRAASLLCSLLAVYLCLVCAPGEEDAILYLTAAIWLFTNLCPKKVSARRPAPRSAPAEDPAPTEGTVPVEETVPAEEPVPAQEVELPEPEWDPEIDAIIAQILREIQEEKE